MKKRPQRPRPERALPEDYVAPPREKKSAKKAKSSAANLAASRTTPQAKREDACRSYDRMVDKVNEKLACEAEPDMVEIDEVAARKRRDEQYQSGDFKHS